MFLNKWTVQVARPGQNEELSFSSKDEATDYAETLLKAVSEDGPVTLILVDPDNKSTALVEKEPELGSSASA